MNSGGYEMIQELDLGVSLGLFLLCFAEYHIALVKTAWDGSKSSAFVVIGTLTLHVQQSWVAASTMKQR